MKFNEEKCLEAFEQWCFGAEQLKNVSKVINVIMVAGE